MCCERWGVRHSREDAGVTKPLTAGLILVALLPGCADLSGKWTSVALDPEMARDQFLLLRPRGYRGDFLRAVINLRTDETYTAEVYYAGDLSFSSGGWSVLGDRLRLMDSEYGAHAYRIQVARDGGTLEIIQPIKGTDVRLIMRREKPLIPLPKFGESK